MIAIRGAITVAENSKEAILEGTKVMLEAIIKDNQLVDEEMVSIFFSATKDLTAVYPAVAARDMGITNASLLCVQEMFIEGSLQMCLRILMHVEKKGVIQKCAKHVYLEKAAALRPDLKQGEAI